MPLLNWVNDTRARSAASEVPFHLLKKISSYGDKSEAKKNLLIQGDNLLALKALLPFYRGKVKCIYIEYYFLQLCGYEGSDLREIVLEKPENRNKFIKQVEGEKPDMTDYQLASSLLAYINNPNGISDGLNYVEDCEDVDAYKRVFQMIFEALGQSQHYKMMTGKRIKS